MDGPLRLTVFGLLLQGRNLQAGVFPSLRSVSPRSPFAASAGRAFAPLTGLWRDQTDLLYQS